MEGPAAIDPKKPLDLMEAIGGPLGMLESGLPPVVFVVVYAIAGTSIETAGIVAVAVALVMGLARLAKRESPRHALSGVIGVAFGAFIAAKSGKAENFFLPGLLLNAAYAAAFLISLAIRRPLVGELVSRLDGEGTGWREQPDRVRAYTRATWLWAGLFLSRVIVQVPLYVASALVVLGVAKTAMGIPLFALGLWWSYRMVRKPAAPAPR